MTLLEHQTYDFLTSKEVFWRGHKNDIILLEITSIKNNFIFYKVTYNFNNEILTYNSQIYFNILNYFIQEQRKQKLKKINYEQC